MMMKVTQCGGRAARVDNDDGDMAAILLRLLRRHRVTNERGGGGTKLTMTTRWYPCCHIFYLVVSRTDKVVGEQIRVQQ